MPSFVRSSLVAGCAASLVAVPIGQTASARGAETDQKTQVKITYAEHVQPILREHCFTCHNQGKAQNDLAMDSYDRLMEGGASGAVIEPGDLASSYLWSLVTHEDEPSMPPNQDKIPDAELAVIEKWIAGGALRDSGSVAKVAKKPAMDLSLSAEAARPDGPVVMPEGLRRQPVVYTPKAGAVTAIASSPQAPLVAVAGQRQVVLYNSDTTEMLGVLPFPEGLPYALRFSRSGTLLLAGGGRGASLGLAAVYDVKSGSRVFAVGDELDAVLAADINREHTLIALGGPQRVVRAYSTADGSLVYQITKHTDWIYAVAFSPDGLLLATGDRSGGLAVWEAATGREFYDLAGHKGAVTDVSWRGDSNVLASAGADGTIRLWAMEDGRQLKSTNAHRGGVTSIDFTHDGRLVSCGRDKLTKVWKPDGSQLRALEAFSDLAMAAAFSHDGGRVIAGDFAGEIRVWKTDDGSQVASLASNPPTLEMVAEAAQAKTVEAKAAADAAAAALAEATRKVGQANNDQQAAQLQTALIEKAVAGQIAAQAAEEAQAAADRAIAERDAFRRQP